MPAHAVCVCERAALTRRPRCQWPLAWRWYKRRLSDGLSLRRAPRRPPTPRLDKLRCETSRRCAGPCPGFVPIGLMRVQPRRWGKHRCYVRKGSRQRGCTRGVNHLFLPLFRVPERGNAARFSNTAKPMMWGRPCLLLGFSGL